jgi:hypothetical protein
MKASKRILNKVRREKAQKENFLAQKGTSLTLRIKSLEETSF